MKKLIVFASLLLPLTIIAQNVQTITVEDLNERIYSKSDTTYIVNFWASWCSPCLKELPAFDSLADYTAGQKVKIMLVSVDNSSQLPALNKLLLKLKPRNQVLTLAGSSEQQYIDKVDSTWSGAIPATLMVNNTKRQFLEDDFTYNTLLKQFLKMQ